MNEIPIVSLQNEDYRRQALEHSHPPPPHSRTVREAAEDVPETVGIDVEAQPRARPVAKAKSHRT